VKHVKRNAGLCKMCPSEYAETEAFPNHLWCGIYLTLNIQIVIEGKTNNERLVNLIQKWTSGFP